MAALLQFIGLILIVVGVWLVFPPAAIVVGGLFMVALVVAWERVNNAGSSVKT